MQPAALNAQVMVTGPAPSHLTTAAQPQVMVLRVMLNTEDRGDIFVYRTADSDFLVKTADLVTMGLKEPQGQATVIEGEPHLFLRSIPGVGFALDEARLVLNIMVEPRFLAGHALNLRASRRLRGVPSQNRSAFVNYALSYRNAGSSNTAADSGKLEFSGEAGLRWGDNLILSTANTVQDADGKRRLVRLMSTMYRDDSDNLQRLVVGDFFTPARELSNSVNVAGVSFGKLYGLDPYFMQQPTQTISGSVALPSELELYLDGQRIRTERLRPGEFELRDIVAYGGARSMQLVLRDAFGRVQQLSYSFYFSDQPLQEGLHDYSYNFGAMRRGYGVQSNRYGPLAFSAFHRYGFSNALTLGLRAEGTRELWNAGPSATIVLGSAGVLSLAAAASGIAGHRGYAGSIGYNYQAPLWNLGFLLRRDSGDYAVMGDPVTVINRKYEWSASVGVNLGSGSLSLSHAAAVARSGRSASPATPAQPFEVVPLSNRRITDLAYSAPLVPGKIALTTRLSHIKEEQKPDRNELFVGLTYFIDREYSAAANVRATSGSATGFAQLSKNQPAGEGLGYVITGDHAREEHGTYSQLRSTLQYNAPAAILRGDYGIRRDLGQSASDYSLSVAGGLAYVGGNLSLARPITDSFGIVKVGELPGVAVAVNGLPMGRTNARGELFIPTLSAYYDNDVTIAPQTVPIEYSIPATSKKVAPSLRSGAVIDFAVTKVQAFTGKLVYQDDGASKPGEYLEVSFSAEGKTQNLRTGRGGEFYVENLKLGTYPATVMIEGKPCQFDLVIPKSDETFVELGELVCRRQP